MNNSPARNLLPPAGALLLIIAAALSPFAARAEPLDVRPPGLARPAPKPLPPPPVRPPVFGFQSPPAQPERLGLLPAAQGLGEDIWQSADPARLLALMQNWTLHADRPAQIALARRLLLTAAPLAFDPETRRRFNRLRLARLYDLGDLDSLNRLAEIWPALLADPELDPLRIRLALAEGRPRRACAFARLRPRQLEARRGETFPLHLAALCAALEGRAEAALFTADLLREGGGDPAFFPLLAAALGQQEDPGAPPRRLTGVELALYRQARRTPPETAAFAAPPALLPLLLSMAAPASPLALAAARRLRLRAVAPPPAAARQDPPAPATAGQDPPPPAAAGQDPLLPAALQEQLAAARNPALYLALLEAYTPALRALDPDPALRGLLPDALAAFLLAQDRNALRRWTALAPSARTDQTPEDQTPETDIMIRAVTLLFRAAAARRNQENQETQNTAPPPDSPLLAALLAGAFAVPGLAPPELPQSAQTMIAAARAGWRGEAVLHVLALLDRANRRAAPDPALFYAATHALVLAGLEDHARQIAVEAAVIHAR